MANEDLIVPTTKAPSYWNRDAAVGFFTGSLIFGPAAGVVGAVIGSFIGEGQMQRELKTGKVVEPPTAWNKDIVIGAGIGNVVGLLAASVMFGTAVLTGLPTVAMAAALPAVALAFGGPIIGGFMGAAHGKKRLATEYVQAQQYVATHAVAPVVARTNEYQISPEQSALLEARLSAAKSNGFANQVNADQAMQSAASR